VDDSKYTLFEHLTELRSRLLKSALGIILTTSVAMIYSEELLSYSIQPLQRILRDKTRLETVLVDDDEARGKTLEERLDDDARLRVVKRITDVEGLSELARDGLKAKKPLDFVLIMASATDALGTRAIDVLDGIEPQPHIVYMVTKPDDPLVAELKFEGVALMLAPPKPARLSREIRQAASRAGKTMKEDKLVVLSPFDPFFAYLKVGLVCGLFASCPIWLYQLWRFIAPGLYDKERNLVLPMIVSASLLFIAGGAFAYFVMFPLMFDVMVNQMMPADLTGSFTVDNYLSLLFTMTLAFGVIFETPLIIAIAARVGLVHPDTLVKYRRYAIVGAFVIGAVLTPADPISQIFMSVPLVIFYEIGIILARAMAKKREEPPDDPTALATT